MDVPRGHIRRGNFPIVGGNPDDLFSTLFDHTENVKVHFYLCEFKLKFATNNTNYDSLEKLISRFKIKI